MCGVDAHIAAAVCTGLLNGDLACRRAHRDELFGHDLRALDHPAVNCDGICLEVDFGVFEDLPLRADGDRFQQFDRFSAF